MNIVRNGFALIGVLAVLMLLYCLYHFEPMYHRFSQFDDKAADTYVELVKQILETGNAAEATVWKKRVSDGLKPEDVEEVMRFVANEHNIKNVGELPLYKQV